ncbi:Asp-tRNA(Asn)/Glu-tRNA(Gln) amidotransferase subunit GatB [Candidatus Woesearchaeota archaeon]|nr:Asp-tRNA(Asn)/Glu-tRNA(Gln) amidotransferase subunit GatB [Candidatus Woesearchaeota archaeon]
MFESEIVIGLEVHAELDTNTKLFCSCPREGNDKRNSRVCPICLGHPGSKPVMNKKVLDYGLRFGLAIGCNIAKSLVFSRKSYFYPDMAKNYQITQFEIPLCSNGIIKLSSGKKIKINRAHIEEDPAALTHPAGINDSAYVLVDYNRSGNPLIEIVTEPDMTSPNEARDFMKELIKILNYLEIFDTDSCIIKADANISIRESGYKRVEVKNITGFKEIERALMYEVERQKQAVSEGAEILMETRSWDAAKGITCSLRLKESEEDYGYITDPDLVPIDVSDELIETIKKNMPELHHAKLDKYKKNISEEDAKVISSNHKLAAIYDEVCEEIDPVFAGRWIRRELMRVMNYNKIEFEDLKIKPSHLIDLFKLIIEGSITDSVGQKIMEKLVEEPFDVNEYVNSNSLKTISDNSELKKICKQVINENPQAAEELKAGNTKSLNFMVGQVMRITKGKADAKKLVEIFKSIF